jgi:hypothetical protein
MDKQVPEVVFDIGSAGNYFSKLDAKISRAKEFYECKGELPWKIPPSTVKDLVKELHLGFGVYCEVFDGIDNTTKARSIPYALHFTFGAIKHDLGNL